MRLAIPTPMIPNLTLNGFRLVMRKQWGDHNADLFFMFIFDSFDQVRPMNEWAVFKIHIAHGLFTWLKLAFEPCIKGYVLRTA